MEKAVFSFDHYCFTKAIINFPKNANEQLNLSVKFTPKGEFIEGDSRFRLYLNTIVSSEIDGSETVIVEVDSSSEFVFSGISKLSEIPVFFYPNSIAILFPYIRSFISTLSLQANFNPIILPTMNLTSLQEELKRNTKEIQ